MWAYTSNCTVLETVLSLSVLCIVSAFAAAFLLQTENKCSVYSHRYFLASHDTAFLSRLKTSTDGHFIVKATRKFSSDTVMSLLSALGRGWMSGKENEPLSVDDQPRTGESSGFVQVSEAVFRCYHALFGASMPPSGRQTWSRLKW